MKLAVKSLILFLAYSLNSLSLAETTSPLDDPIPEPEQTESWYKIELLIFANEDAQALASETWPETSSYPDISTGILLTHGTPSTQSNSHQKNNPSTTGTSIPASEVIETEPQDRSNREYIKLLSEKHKTFIEHLDKLDHAGTYRVLFHETWRQSLEDMDAATPVVVVGGIQQNEYHELAGHIKFSVNRYLHIQTDLFLNTFGEEELSTEENGIELSPPSDVNELGEQGLLFPEPNFSSAISNKDENNILIESEIALVPKLSVPLQQTRRMRSQELHYIDHPLMGILVRLEPYEPPAKPVSVDSLQIEQTAPIELDSLLDRNNG